MSTETPLRDAQLNTCMHELRRSLGSSPRAVAAYKAVRDRLKYLDRTVGAWDAHHAGRARAALADGRIDRASLDAELIFAPDLRLNLLRQVQRLDQPDATAADRIAEALELGREVLV